MRMLRRNALSFLTCMPIAAAAGGASVATAAVPEEKPKTSGKILFETQVGRPVTGSQK